MYTGQRMDLESGLLFYKNRYLSTSFGRFISRDAIGFDPRMGDLCLYQYMLSNPLAGMDPEGLTPAWLLECGVGAAIGGIGGCLGGLFSTWSWRGTLCGGLSGAVTGCCTALLCANAPGLCGYACLCGMAGAFVGQLCDGGFDYKDPCAWAGLLFGAGAGCLGGLPATLKDEVFKFLTGMNVAMCSNICSRAVKALQGKR